MFKNKFQITISPCHWELFPSKHLIEPFKFDVKNCPSRMTYTWLCITIAYNLKEHGNN